LPITPVTRWRLGFIDLVTGKTYIAYRGFHVKDIHEVLRQKQAQQAQLGKQIEALQAAAEQIRGVAHLLNDEEGDRETAGVD
jgi:cell division protein FtsB